jgi:hypothetical protein
MQKKKIGRMEGRIIAAKIWYSATMAGDIKADGSFGSSFHLFVRRQDGVT